MKLKGKRECKLDMTSERMLGMQLGFEQAVALLLSKRLVKTVTEKREVS